VVANLESEIRSDRLRRFPNQAPGTLLPVPWRLVVVINGHDGAGARNFRR
jgi:hypothetical protein